MIKFKKGIIIGLGTQGYQIVSHLNKRLQQRHGGVSVIQGLALLSAEQENQLKHLPHEPDILTLSLGPERLNSLQQDTTVAAWLPTNENLSLSYRAGARLALPDLYDIFNLTLNNIINHKIHQPTAQTIMHSKKEQSSNNSNTDMSIIDIYLVGNLGDPIAGGLLVDLAYLIRHLTDQREADFISFELNSILLLPQLYPAWNEMTASTRRWIGANAYATLKELNYYLGSHPYTFQYPNLKQPISYSKLIMPFRHCYLLGPTNEANYAITPQDSLNLSAEWLYNYFITPVNTHLNVSSPISQLPNQQSINAYSSFGLASLTLPISPLRTYCTHRLIYELLDRYLLKKLSLDEKETQTKKDMQRSGFSNSFSSDFSNDFLNNFSTKLSNELANTITTHNTDDFLLDTKKQSFAALSTTLQQYTIAVDAYDHNFSVLDHIALENRLIETYSHCLSQVFPDIKKQMVINKQTLEKEILKHLKDYICQLLDTDPVAALDRSRNLLEAFIDKTRQQQSLLTAYIEKANQTYQQQIHHIKERRGLFFSAAQTFGEHPIFQSLFLTPLACVLMLISVYYIWVQQMGQPELAALISGGAILLWLGIAWSNYSLIKSTQAAFIQAYNARLQSHRHRESLYLEAEMTNNLEQNLLNLQDELTDFWQDMQQVHLLAKTQLQQKQLQLQKLYNQPHFSLEETVLHQRDINQYYNEVWGQHNGQSNNKIKHLNDLFESGQYGGRYTDWLQLPRPQSAASGSFTAKAELLWSHLKRYATTQTEVLTHHRLVEKMEQQYNLEEIEKGLSKLQQHASPFLAARLMELGPDADIRLNYGIITHFKADEGDPTTGCKIAKVLHQKQQLQNVIDFGENDRLSIISIRRGLSLHILPDVLACAASYRTIPNLNLVHTTRGNIALPDVIDFYPSIPLPDPDTLAKYNAWEAYLHILDPRQAIALLAVVNHLKFPPFTVLEQPVDDKTVTYNSSSLSGYILHFIEPKQQELAQKFNRLPKAIAYHLGSTKAEACATLYTNHRLFFYLRSELQKYFHTINLADFGQGLYDYVTHIQQNNTVGDDTSILDDWELLALQQALEKLPDSE